MGFIQGEVRGQQTLFPVTLDELIPADHLCRVIEAFVGRLDMEGLGFVRAEPAETGRPGYDPRDLLKLYLYGYLQQVRSSRRLEAECRRNVEVMWLLGRLEPDYKSIAEFRRMHREAVTEAGAELVRFARSVGLVRGEWVAIDGSKFRAVSSAKSVRERESVKRYLAQLESADEQDAVVIDPSAMAAALEKLKNYPEPEARSVRRKRCMWWPMRATRTASKPNVVKLEESCHTYQPIVASTTKAMGRCLTEPSSSTTKIQTASGARRGRFSHASSSREQKRGLSMRPQRKPVRSVPRKGDAQTLRNESSTVISMKAPCSA